VESIQGATIMKIRKSDRDITPQMGILLLAFLLLTANPLFSQNKINLEKEKFRKFFLYKISVKIIGSTNPIICEDEKYNFICSESKKWVAYQGKKMISENEFYKKTGYEKYIQMLKSQKRSWNPIMGIISGVVGGLLINRSFKYYSRQDKTFTTIGGVFFISAGINIFTRALNRENLVSYGVAKRMADEYNRKLILKIINNK